MLKPTKPFRNTISSDVNEPSLRIGRTVPDNAVNLAYYFNPTATDSEKIMSAEAPRNTIDHRVEEAYRYLFKQPTDDDNLFPSSVYFEDEEGYSGRLGRMYVTWYPKVIIETKKVPIDELNFVVDKSYVKKTKAYSQEGFEGTLYLDAVEWDVNKWTTIPQQQPILREVKNHEIIYSDVFTDASRRYVTPERIDEWTKNPRNGSSPWPKEIIFNENGQDAANANGASVDVVNYIKKQKNQYEGATGILTFDSVNYEPVYEDQSIEDGKVQGPTAYAVTFKSKKYTVRGSYPSDGLELTPPDLNMTDPDQNNSSDYSNQVETRMEQLRSYLNNNKFRKVFEAKYNETTDKYDYTDINAFVNGVLNDPTVEKSGDVSQLKVLINNYLSYSYGGVEEELSGSSGGDISIYMYDQKTILDDDTNPSSDFWFEFKYKIICSSRGQNRYTRKYNVVANYTGTLTKFDLVEKKVPAEYKGNCHYIGIVRKIHTEYDGMAYYRGAVTKGNSIGSVNPEDDNELLMFSDKDGYLRRIVRLVDENGYPYIENFYGVEADYVYITDVFKDGVACFYKYPLQKPIYDYRGPDANGFYEGSAAKVSTASYKDIPADYKYAVKLENSAYEEVDVITNDFNLITKKIPSEYKANLYCSFISGATDTFKVSYNSYDSKRTEIESGCTEAIYNYPFMTRGRDYIMEAIDERSRLNKIKLPEARRFEDTRRWISFGYKIKATRKPIMSEDGSEQLWPERTVESVVRYASILNKDYAVKSEYDNFEGRGYIISPKYEESYMSPMQIMMLDESKIDTEPLVKGYDVNIVYSAEIVEIYDTYRGGVNLKCNPDGSGIITAETTIDTGFFDEESGLYNIKLAIDAPYLIEGNYIYPGFKVKCVDSRYIKVQGPRNYGLLDSWYPLIQFGHYSRVIDQHGVHVKVAYTMPEYDTQKFSENWGMPYVDVSKEKATVLNPHMIRTKSYPLHIFDITIDADTFIYKNGTIFRVYKQQKSWKDAEAFCESIGGTLAMPKDEEISDFIIDIAKQYNINGLWLGATNEEDQSTWKWVDGTLMTNSNWSTGEPNNYLDRGEWYLETYCITGDGKWNDLPNETTEINGFICQWDKIPPIRVYKKVGDELFRLEIDNVSFKDGIIVTKDTVSENDTIVVDYTYVEENYEYRGYWRDDTDFVRLDLNPNIYHTYNDPKYTPSETKPSKNLFNKVLYFFLKPTATYEIPEEYDSLVYNEVGYDAIKDDFTLLTENTKGCLYHQIDNPEPLSDEDIYIGSVYIKQDTSLHSTVLIDSRTRGGGILDSMPDKLRHELEPESDYYLDIGYYDGKPYQENGVIIVRLDQRLLKEFGGRFTQGDVEVKVKRWLGAGIYPIIEYVDSYMKAQLPQYNMEIEDTYTNIEDVIPEFTVESVETNA